MIRAKWNEVLSAGWALMWIVLLALPLLNWSGRPRTGRWIVSLTNTAVAFATTIGWQSPNRWVDGMRQHLPQSHPVGWYYVYTAAFWLIAVLVIGWLIYLAAGVFDAMSGTTRSSTPDPPLSTTTSFEEMPVTPVAPIAYGGITSFWELLLGRRQDGLSDYESALAAGRTGVRMGMVLIAGSFIFLGTWLIDRSLWALAIVGGVLVFIGLSTCASGLTTVRNAQAHQRAVDEQERLLDTLRRRESWALEHEFRMKELERVHQRLLVELRQPHELSLKAQELTLALAQMVSIAKSEDKFEKFQAIFDRLQRKTDQMTDDIRRRDLDPEEKQERIDAVTREITDLAQRMVREL